MNPRALRTERENDTRRAQLEADLLQSGWLETYPKWLERDDRIFEKKNRRVLIDVQGAFTYKVSWGTDHRTATWKRHRGIVGFDRGKILDMFEKVG